MALLNIDSQQWRELVQLFAKTLGAESLKQAIGQLSPEELLAKAEESLKSQFKEILTEALQEADIKGVVDELYQSLDENKVIEGITPSLASDMSAYFKDEGSEVLLEALVRSIIDDYLDLDDLTQQVAEKVTARLQIAEP